MTSASDPASRNAAWTSSLTSWCGLTLTPIAMPCASSPRRARGGADRPRLEHPAQPDLVGGGEPFGGGRGRHGEARERLVAADLRLCDVDDRLQRDLQRAVGRTQLAYPALPDAPLVVGW